MDTNSPEYVKHMCEVWKENDKRNKIEYNKQLASTLRMVLYCDVFAAILITLFISWKLTVIVVVHALLCILGYYMDKKYV